MNGVGGSLEERGVRPASPSPGKHAIRRKYHQPCYFNDAPIESSSELKGRIMGSSSQNRDPALWPIGLAPKDIGTL